MAQSIRHIIDIHCHWFPEGLIRLLERDGPRHGVQVRQLPSGDRSLHFIRWPHPPLRPFVDIDHRMAYMDEVGVRTHVLSLSGQVTPIWLEPEFGEAIAQIVNDEYASLQAQYPEKFVGAAAVPLQDPKRAIAELERAVKIKKLRGVNLLANIQGKYLDAPEFWPFYELVQELRIPVLVHPTDPGGSSGVNENALFALVGFPMDTTITINRLIFSGVFDRFPHIPWIFCHGGGTAPYLGGRWDHGYKLGFTGAKGLERAPGEYLASLYFDTLVYNPETLRFLVNCVGPDHVLMGTDYAYELMADPDPVGTVYSIPNLENDHRTKILGGNAAGLFGL